MQLLRLQDVPTQRGDCVYRHPRLRAALVWLAGVGLAASLLIHAVVTRWPPGYIFGVPLLLIMLMTRAAPAPVRKHWYGSSSTLYRDYPLSICEPRVLRIHWNVTPSAQKFLNALRPYTGITDSVSLTQDFHHLKTLGPQEQRAKIRELAARGDTMTAVYIARKLYGGSLGQAKQMVDSLGTTTA